MAKYRIAITNVEYGCIDVESIFNVADEDYDGKVFGAGEDIEDED